MFDYNLPLLIIFSLYTILIVIIALLVLNARQFYKEVMINIRIHTWIILVLLFFLNVAISYMYVDTIMIDDEFSYPVIADTMSGWNIDEIGHLGKHIKPFGFPFLISITFSIFGSSMAHVYIINMLIGALSVIAIFFVSYMLFNREDTGLYSAAIMAVFPLNIGLANTMEIHSSSVLFSLLVLAAFLFYVKVKTFPSKLLAVFMLIFTLYFRNEFLVLLIPMTIFMLLFDNTIKSKWKENLILFAIFLSYIIPDILYLYIVGTTGYMQYPFNGSPLSLSRIPSNLINAGFLTPSFSYLFVLFSIGSVHLFLKRKREFLFLYIWIVTFSILYYSYWTGSKGIDTFPFQSELFLSRFFLVIYATIIPVWSVGLSFVSDSLKITTGWIKRNSQAFSIILVLFILAAFSPFHLSKTNYFLHDYGVYLAIERDAALYLDSEMNGCTLVFPQPFFLSDKNEIIDSKTFIDSQYLLVEPKEGCILYVEDFFCASPLRRAETSPLRRAETIEACQLMKEEFVLEHYVSLDSSMFHRLLGTINGDMEPIVVYNISSRRNKS